MEDTKINNVQATEETKEEVKQEQKIEQNAEITKDKIPENLIEEFRKNYRAEWEKEQQEKERLAKMTQAEREKELQRLKEEEIAKRERMIEDKEVQILLRDELVANSLDLELKDIFDTNKYIGKDNKAELLNQDIVKVKKLIDTLVQKQVEAYKQAYLKGETPSGLEKQETKATSALDLILNKLK